MTRQELFDRVVKHCNRQGMRSMLYGKCRYRAGRGASCAIGGLMPDGVYSKDLEGLQAHDLPVSVLEACGFNMGRSRERAFAYDLQCLHDGEHNWGKRKLLGSQVKMVAHKWKLEVPK